MIENFKYEIEQSIKNRCADHQSRIQDLQFKKSKLNGNADIDPVAHVMNGGDVDDLQSLENAKENAIRLAPIYDKAINKISNEMIETIINPTRLALSRIQNNYGSIKRATKWIRGKIQTDEDINSMEFKTVHSTEAAINRYLDALVAEDENLRESANELSAEIKSITRGL